MYILTGVNLDKIAKLDSGLNTVIYNKIDTVLDTMVYFSKTTGDAPLSYTADELAKDVKTQSSKKEPLIIRRGRYVWSIIEV